MKKTISAVLVCVLLACTLLTLASCGKSLSGKYTAEVDLLVGKASVTYEFGAFGKVTITTNSLGKETVQEGKYELNDAADEITIILEDKDGKEESNSYKFAQGEENGVKYVKIGLIKYEKTK